MSSLTPPSTHLAERLARRLSKIETQTEELGRTLVATSVGAGRPTATSSVPGSRHVDSNTGDVWAYVGGSWLPLNLLKYESYAAAEVWASDGDGWVDLGGPSLTVYTPRAESVIGFQVDVESYPPGYNRRQADIGIYEPNAWWYVQHIYCDGHRDVATNSAGWQRHQNHGAATITTDPQLACARGPTWPVGGWWFLQPGVVGDRTYALRYRCDNRDEQGGGTPLDEAAGYRYRYFRAVVFA